MSEVFYTEEQKEVLKKESDSLRTKRSPLSESTGLIMLDVLGEQQNTLQNIYSILQRIEVILLGR